MIKTKYKHVHKMIHKMFHLSNRTRRRYPFCASMRYTRNLLGDIYRELGFNVGAEIGVRRGEYSKVLLKANQNLKLFCVDPWGPYPGRRYTKEIQEGIYQQARKNLAPYNVEFVRKQSLKGVHDFEDESLDFVFIDGDHRYNAIARDIIEWQKKVKQGGIISVHDFFLGEPGVHYAVEGYIKGNNIRPYYITKEHMPTAFWVKE